VLPTLQTELHTSAGEITWVLTSYLLSASVCTPILGRLGDRHGKRLMLMVSLGALAAGSLLAALATDLPVMVVARVIQGAGGGVLPLSFGIAHDQLPRERVAAAIGFISAVCGVGSGLGVVLAGPIIAALDYHWLFWIPLIPTALAAIAAFGVIGPGRTERTGRLRPSTFLLLATWLIALLLAVSQGSLWGWRSPAVVSLFVAAALAVPLWVLAENRAPAPLIDMRMMRRRAVWTNNLATLLTGTCMFGSLTFCAELAQNPTSTGFGFGASVTEAGFVIAPQPVLVIVVGTLTGRLVGRIGSHLVLVCGAAACTAAMLLVAVAHSAEWELYLAMGIIGVGIGLAVAAQGHLAVTSVPRHQTGVSAGMNANIRLIGGSIGAALMGAVVTSSASRTGRPTVTGYSWAFGVIALVCLAGVAVAARVPAPVSERPAALPELVPRLDDACLDDT
jgi:MFS family permease